MDSLLPKSEKSQGDRGGGAWGGKGRQLLATKARVHIQKLKLFTEQASYSSNTAQGEEVQEILISMLPICPHQLCVSGEMIVYAPELLWLETAAFSVAVETFLLPPFQVLKSVHTECRRNAFRSQGLEE